jgi:hypothetical protein
MKIESVKKASINKWRTLQSYMMEKLKGRGIKSIFLKMFLINPTNMKMNNLIILYFYSNCTEYYKLS